jgi:cysteine synthase A
MLKLNAGDNSAEVYVKLESFNPGGSVKDRIAWAMLKDAMENGKIGPDTIILEATSGNTGIGLAMAATAMGISLTLVMPDTMSVERRQLLAAYGATIVLTPGAQGMLGAIGKAQEYLAEDKRYLHLDQFSNPANPRIHHATTGPEIYRHMEGKLDAFVVGVGTGGTLTGAGGFLKSHIAGLNIYAVEPALSPVLSGGEPGPHPIQGIGAGFVPKILNIGLIDKIITVQAENAQHTTRQLARRHGILAGISAGAAVWAAFQVAKQIGPGKRIATVIPDTGERYLSTPLFATEQE